MVSDHFPRVPDNQGLGGGVGRDLGVGLGRAVALGVAVGVGDPKGI